jgi:brefeldin A-resistance guanine nucleotide exchange factor 1
MELWTQTWKRLERFLPDLKQELFPPMPEKRKPAVKEEEGGPQEKDAATENAADAIEAESADID